MCSSFARTALDSSLTKSACFYYPFLCHLLAYHHVPHTKHVNAWARKHYQWGESSPPFPTQRSSRFPISSGQCSDWMTLLSLQLLAEHPQLSRHSLHCDCRATIRICPLSSAWCLVRKLMVREAVLPAAPPDTVGLVLVWMSVCSTETGCSSLCLA